MNAVDLDRVAHILRQVGWDVTIGEGEVLASRADKGGPWSLAVDGTGRLLFTAVRTLRPARLRRLTRAGVVYRTAWEEQGIFTVAVDIREIETLQRLLGDLSLLVRRAGRL